MAALPWYFNRDTREHICQLQWEQAHGQHLHAAVDRPDGKRVAWAIYAGITDRGLHIYISSNMHNRLRTVGEAKKQVEAAIPVAEAALQAARAILEGEVPDATPPQHP